MRIYQNIEALNGQRNLSLIGVEFSKSVERLSSGLRINRAGDDAAGLAISEKLRAQVRGTNQASRNAQDAISMVQTAEGALTEVHSMLQRMRELAVQASNDTLTDTDRASINTELQALKNEVNGISSRTTFNGKQLLTGAISSSLDSSSELSVGDNLTSQNAALVTAINVSSAKAGTTYSITSTAAGKLTLTRVSDSVSQTITVSDMSAAGTQTLNWDQLGISVTITSAGAKDDTSIVADITQSGVDTIAVAGSGSATFQVGPSAGQTISHSFDKVALDGTVGDSSGLDALNTALSNFNSSSTQANASALITAVDNAIDKINTKRSNLGAVQNRLEHAIANLDVTAENLSASESRIRDADMAKEMVKFTRNQILRQAGMSVLAQANQAPQGVLSLLR